MLSIGPSWRLLRLRTQAKMAIPLGKGTVALHFGAAAQSIEEGQVYVITTSVPADASGK
jgi:dTDP-4-amino-4,6-dideoxygalactose transaminase